MTPMPEPSTPQESGTVRFRIELVNHGECWEAIVYDHEDHGPDLMYAGVTAGSLAQVLEQAAHYVLVAV